MRQYGDVFSGSCVKVQVISQREKKNKHWQHYDTSHNTMNWSAIPRKKCLRRIHHVLSEVYSRRSFFCCCCWCFGPLSKSKRLQVHCVGLRGICCQKCEYNIHNVFSLVRNHRKLWIVMFFTTLELAIHISFGVSPRLLLQSPQCSTARVSAGARNKQTKT